MSYILTVTHRIRHRALFLLVTAAFAVDGPADYAGTGTVGSTVDGSIVDDAAAGWVWRDAVEIDDTALHCGSAHAGRSGCYGAYTFQGPSVAVFCMAGRFVEIDGTRHKLGRITISIDNVQQGEYSLQTPQPDYDYCVFKTSGLSAGNHVLEVRADGGWIVVDYIRVAVSPGAVGASTSSMSAGPTAIASEGAKSSVANFGTSPGQPGRALWVWKTLPLITDAAQQLRFFQFVSAPYGNPAAAVNRIFCGGIPPGQLDDGGFDASLIAFIDAAHQHHIRVDFLGGEPTWATPQRQGDGLECLRRVLHFNRKSTKSRFDGFDFDVQPYLLPGWPRDDQMAGLVDLLDKANRIDLGDGGSIPLTAIIPHWYSERQFKNLDRSVIDRVNEVIILDYATTAGDLAFNADPILNYAYSKGKPVWIGVDTTGPQSPTTFYGFGAERMEYVLGIARHHFKDTFQQYSVTFAGYAIESYESYTALGP